ncbi:hypothetical protein CRUP_029317 [Coryphaenoides rupestris]|nr:hypothetical protein CRUP_029317 [Coryphaenoides rupestris]
MVTEYLKFYFLSDDELLEILSQTKDPTAVQPHLRKCFENIARLKFQADLQISHMYSGEGEEVELVQPVWPHGNVENWLRDVEKSMKASLRDSIHRSLQVYPEQPRTEWVLSWPGQVVIAGCQVFWTAEVSEALERGDLAQRLYPQLQTQLGDLVQLVRGGLSRMQRAVLSALIVIEVHAKDVVAKLVEEGVSSVNDFEWISQLRYYWAEEDLYIRAVNAEFLYGYEYLGNSGRLVITPLTDRCYLTLTGALHLKFGGAPAGPAGTGKTETTKDLGKALAIQTVVFNCSDQLDFIAMGKLLKGLASSGAWACFDEFNRIDVEVLSVVAQQITTIQKAQQQRISLYSFGFSDAKVLSKKITSTFKLSSEQLSSQDHYDFGMRAVKTVISAAGNLKRENPDMDEELICLRAIRDVNVPKFLQDDLKLFNGIVSDLFPKIKEEPIDYGTLEESIRNVCTKRNLKDVDGYITKCIQLYETTVVRHGLMLVGPAGSGKTKCYEILGAAMTALKGQPSVSGGVYEAVRIFVLNPKSITMGQLYWWSVKEVIASMDSQLACSLLNLIDCFFKPFVPKEGVKPPPQQNLNRLGELVEPWFMFSLVWSVGATGDGDSRQRFSAWLRGKMAEEKGVFGPPPGKYFVFFIDDLNMPMLETYGAQPPIELLRQWMDHRGWYDRKQIGTFKQLVDINFACAMGPPGGGRNPVTQRFTRHFNLLALAEMEDASKRKIFSTILGSWMGGLMSKKEPGIPVPALQPLNTPLVDATLRVYSTITSQLLPTPAKSHYTFNLRDLSKVFQGVLMAEASSVEDKVQLLRLWYHESCRVFQDRLVSPEDRDWFERLLQACVEELGCGMEEVVPARPVLYGDFMIPGADNKLVLFMDALRHVCSISRVLRQPLGNALLLGVLCVGPTGTGKTLTMSDKLLNNMPAEYITHFLNFSARTSANQTQDYIDSKLDKRYLMCILAILTITHTSL